MYYCVMYTFNVYVNSVNTPVHISCKTFIVSVCTLLILRKSNLVFLFVFVHKVIALYPPGKVYMTIIVCGTWFIYNMTVKLRYTHITYP